MVGEKKRMTISLVGRSKEKDTKHKEKEKEKEKEPEVKQSKVRFSLSDLCIQLDSDAFYRKIERRISLARDKCILVSCWRA